MGSKDRSDKGIHQKILDAKRERRWQDAVAVIKEVRSTGRKLPLASYNCAIDACGKAKQVDQALSLFEELVRGRTGGLPVHPPSPAPSVPGAHARPGRLPSPTPRRSRSPLPHPSFSPSARFHLGRLRLAA